MRLSLFATAATLCLSSLAARADAVYTYTGQYFEFANAPYSTSDRITGEFTFSAPLAANFNSPREIPVSYSLSDGVETLTQANSSFGIADLGTDASGNINIYDYIIIGSGGVTLGIAKGYGDDVLGGRALRWR